MTPKGGLLHAATLRLKITTALTKTHDLARFDILPIFANLLILKNSEDSCQMLAKIVDVCYDTR